MGQGKAWCKVFVSFEVVASGAVRSPNDVQCYIKSTLLAATKDFQDVVALATRESLKWLSTNGFLR